ncbi:MAG: M50 family metallopeptidase [Patescibacteria group bacterium]|jgi:regulator of sigma E protease
MSLVSILVFILVLSILIFVHELGHFFAAKKAGIFVEEFGFGLPPRLFGKKVGETIYSLNAFPFGGFVKMYGEDGVEEIEKLRNKGIKGRAFGEKSILRRFSVLVAGVTMNVILALAIFSIFYYIVGIPTPTGQIKVLGIMEESPAQAAGLQAEDTIVSIDSIPVKDSQTMIALLEEKAGREVQMEIVRGENQNMVVSLTPRELSWRQRLRTGPIGAGISDSIFTKDYPFWQIPFLGAQRGIEDSLEWGKNTILGLADAVATLFEGHAPEVAGPIGMAKIADEATKSGYLAVMQLLGILSINLAIMNFLPLPALDGGRIAFLAYEAITRKKPSPKIESTINMAGFIFLISLMVLISINDIFRLFR